MRLGNFWLETLDGLVQNWNMNCWEWRKEKWLGIPTFFSENITTLCKKKLGLMRGIIWQILAQNYKIFIIVRTNGIYNASICNNANFNWKSLKSHHRKSQNLSNYEGCPNFFCIVYVKNYCEFLTKFLI